MCWLQENQIKHEKLCHYESVELFCIYFCARRLERHSAKNITLLNGKPLIAYSIETALACPSISRVIVSTDDEEIALVARQYGAEVPFMRPKELAQDNSSEWQAWQHAIRFMQKCDAFDVFVSLPATAPLRNVEDVEKCINLLSHADTDIVVTVKPAERNPYFNMVKVDRDGFSHLVCKGDDVVYNRQVAPMLYDMTTVAYVAKPDFILNATSIFEGRVRSVVVPAERAIDIDTPFDLKIADMLMKESVQ